MKPHNLTIKDAKHIKATGVKTVLKDGSIIYKLYKYYRFSDATIIVSQIGGLPYNEIEIHGKLMKSAKDITYNDYFSFCEAKASETAFNLLAY